MPHTVPGFATAGAALESAMRSSPLTDAAKAVEAARSAITAAAGFPEGPQRDARIADASLHLDTAKHHVSTARIQGDAR